LIGVSAGSENSNPDIDRYLEPIYKGNYYFIMLYRTIKNFTWIFSFDRKW